MLKKIIKNIKKDTNLYLYNYIKTTPYKKLISNIRKAIHFI